MQLDFFIDESKMSNCQAVSWSYSKMGTLRSCPRKFYYQYYGSKKRSAKADPQKDKIIFLSKFSNRHLIPGSIVHDAIALYFRKAKANEKWDINKLKWRAHKMLNESIKYSIELKNASIVSSAKFPPDIFKELYYSTIPESELKDKMTEKINDNIDVFYSSEKFKHLKIGGQGEDSIVENNASFLLTPSIEVNGKIDISFTSGNDFIIADWKTGNREIEDNSLQLLTYALWAIDQKKTEGKSIKIQKAYLIEDELEEFEYSETHLLRAKMKIIQDSESLASLDKYGKKGVMEAFTKCGQKKICDLCAFQETCDLT